MKWAVFSQGYEGLDHTQVEAESPAAAAVSGKRSGYVYVVELECLHEFFVQANEWFAVQLECLHEFFVQQSNEWFAVPQERAS